MIVVTPVIMRDFGGRLGALVTMMSVVRIGTVRIRLILVVAVGIGEYLPRQTAGALAN